MKLFKDSGNDSMLEYGMNVSMGTTNKKNPNVVYIEGSSFIEPSYDGENGYSEDIEEIKSSCKAYIKETLREHRDFTSSFILIFDICSGRMKKGKRSFFSFELVVKQKGSMTMSEMETECLPYIAEISNHIGKAFTDAGFVLNKKKKNDTKKNSGVDSIDNHRACHDDIIEQK